MTYNEAIEQIERALFDQDETGMRDTEWGEMVLTEIGVLRLRRILKEFRDPKPKKRKK